MIQRRDFVDGSGFLYDVGVSVGAGGYNYQEDLMLVQYFMCNIALVGLIKGDPTFSDLLIDVDGIIGPETLKAIRTYQLANPQIIIPDGRVDPHEVTICALNDDFFAAFPNLDHGAPGTWPPPPPLLAAALARVAAQ